MHDNYLIHYGVLGMKWGVRKTYEPGFTGKMDKLADDLKNKRIKNKYARQRGKELADKYSTEKILKITNKTCNIGLKFVESYQFELRDHFTKDRVNEITNRLNAKADSVYKKT